MQARQISASKRPTIPALRMCGMRLISDDAAGLTDAETWLGTQLDFIISFAETGNASGTWTDSLAALQASITALQPLNRPIYWAFPLCHGTVGNQAVNTLAGTHDATIKAMFAAILACRPNDARIFIRLGWEMNFWSAYPWCRAFINPTQYKQLYQRIVTIARSVSPSFVFDWCPNVRVIGKDQAIVDPTQFYPGDDYVDIIATDAYLRYDIEFTINGTPTAQTVINVWDGTWGINALYAFAETRGKPFGIAETGVTGGGGGSNGTEGDLYSAHYNRLYEFVRSKNVVFHGHWNKATPFNCRLSGNQYATCATVVKDGFDKVAKTWTLVRQFGRELVEWFDVSDAATLTLSGALVTTITDKVAGKTANQAGSARPTYSATARNGLPGISADGADDCLIQTDVTNIPAQGKAVTNIMQCYVDAAAANFSYLLADTDATGVNNTRAFGHNANNLRIQGDAGYAGGTIKGQDNSIVISYADSYDTTGGKDSTVQGSINGAAPWADNVSISMANFTISKRVLFANGAGSDGVANRIVATEQEIATISRQVSTAETDMIHGYLGWKWRLSGAHLPANHVYRNAAPVYGGVLA